MVYQKHTHTNYVTCSWSNSAVAPLASIPIERRLRCSRRGIVYQKKITKRGETCIEQCWCSGTKGEATWKDSTRNTCIEAKRLAQGTEATGMGQTMDQRNFLSRCTTQKKALGNVSWECLTWAMHSRRAVRVHQRDVYHMRANDL